MNRPPEQSESDIDDAVLSIFSIERKKIKTDPDRTKRIMQRIHREAYIHDIGLMVFIRLWLSMLQIGAVFYAAHSKRQMNAYKPKNIILNEE